MFYKCFSLKSINISNFNTEKTSDMDYMFYHCSNLSSIDISNFVTKKNKEYLFIELPKKGV